MVLYLRCVFHDGRIYLIGGFNGQSRVRTVDIYCPQTREWSSGPEMISRRGTLGVGLLNDTIYAVGGFDGSTGLNSVECWNLNSEIAAWNSVAPLNVRRSSVGIAVLKQFMYVGKWRIFINPNRQLNKFYSILIIY